MVDPGLLGRGGGPVWIRGAPVWIRGAPGQMAQPSVDGNLKNRLSLSKIGGGGTPPAPPWIHHYVGLILSQNVTSSVAQNVLYLSILDYQDLYKHILFLAPRMGGL